MITDQVNKGDLKIRYCPTDANIGDNYTKALQGKKFEEFRNVIMGMSNVQQAVHYPQECVGSAVKRAENAEQNISMGSAGKQCHGLATNLRERRA